jgi:hypothetical protein
MIASGDTDIGTLSSCCLCPGNVEGQVTYIIGSESGEWKDCARDVLDIVKGVGAMND